MKYATDHQTTTRPVAVLDHERGATVFREMLLMYIESNTTKILKPACLPRLRAVQLVVQAFLRH